MVLRQHKQYASEQDMASYMKLADEHAAEIQKNLDAVLQQMDDFGERLESYGKIIIDHDRRLQQHDEMHAEQKSWNEEQQQKNQRFDEELVQLKKQLSQSSLGGHTGMEAVPAPGPAARTEDAGHQARGRAPGAVRIHPPGHQEQEGGRGHPVLVPDILSLELTQEQVQAYDAALRTPEDQLVRPFVYSKAFLTLGRRGSRGWLSDGVINEFFSLLKARVEGRYYYSSHFFDQLTKSDKNFDSNAGINYQVFVAGVRRQRVVISLDWTCCSSQSTRERFTGGYS